MFGKSGVGVLKTIIYGRVTPEHLADAELFAGITPTSYITNGKHTPPASNLETEVIPQCPMVPGDPGVKQNHWRLVAYADALILACDNDHLLGVARRMDLLIHEVEG